MKKAIVYLHADKDRMWDIGADDLGLKGEALGMFRHALTEVEIELQVDEKTGKAEIMKVDGRAVT